jgi:hypothetical protein
VATWKWYGAALLGQFGNTAARRMDLTADDIKMMLTTVTYVPDQDVHDFRNDVTNEVSGTGYTAGGASIVGKAISYDAASNEFRFVFSDQVWGPGATITGARVAVLYKNVGTAATDPLLGYAVLDGDLTVSNGTLTIDVDATTALKITAA